MKTLNWALILVGPFVVVFGLDSIANRHVLGDSMRHPLRTTAAGVRLVAAVAYRAARAACVPLRHLANAAASRRSNSRGAALPGPGQPGYEARVRALLTAPEWPVIPERSGGAR